MAPIMLLIGSLLALFVHTALAVENNSSCSDLGPKWQEAGGRCFYVKQSERPRNYEETESYCRKMDSNIPMSSISLVSEILEIFVNDSVNREKDESEDENRVWWNAPLDVVSSEEYLEYEDIIETKTQNCFRYELGFKTPVVRDCAEGLRIIMCEKSIPEGKFDPEIEMKQNCPAEWKKFGNRCYLFSTKAKTHTEAGEDCKDKNGSLVSIHSQDLQDFLTINVGIEKKDSWTGLKALDRHSAHQWLDGTKFDYRNWARGEPSSTVSMGWTPMFEPCVYIRAALNLAGQWNDGLCETKMGYICQSEPGDYEDSDTETQCPKEGFIPYRKACYKVELDQKPFHEAEFRCQQFGPKAHLVSITDFYEQHTINILFKNLTERFWIGLSDTNKKYGNLLRWTDDWPVYFSNLQKDEFQIRGLRNRRCVAQINKTSWEVTTCNSSLPFICKSTNEVPPKEETNLLKCPGNKTWLDVGASYCYHVSEDTAYNWLNAQRKCNQLDPAANLVTFYSKHEEELLRPFIRKLHRHIWIGLRRIKGVYQWADGSNSSHRGWAYGEPNGHRDECVQMYHSDQEWNDIGCNHGGAFYICAMPKVLKPVVTEKPLVPTVQVASNTTAEITETNTSPTPTVKTTETSSSLQSSGNATEAISTSQFATDLNEKTINTFSGNGSSLHDEADSSGKNSVSTGVITIVVVLVVLVIISFVAAGFYFWNRRKQNFSNEGLMLYDKLTGDIDESL